MSQSLSLFFTKKHQAPSGNWITVTFCNICGHRVGSRKIHANLHKMEVQGFKLDEHHNNTIGRYLEIFNNIGLVTFKWTDLEDKGSEIHAKVKFDWASYTAMTAIDREIRNVLAPSKADINTAKERDTRDYYSSVEITNG